MGWEYRGNATETERRTRRIPNAALFSILLASTGSGSNPNPPAKHNFFDDFNRANGPLGPNWTGVDPGGASFVIFQYPAQSPGCANNGNVGGWFYNGFAGYTDVQVEATLSGGNLASAGLIELFARSNASLTSRWTARVTTAGGLGGLVLLKNGVSVGIGTTSGAPAVGDIATLRCVGSNILFKYTQTNTNIVIITTVDADPGPGRCGVSTGAIGGAAWDNFTITDLS